MYHSIALWGHPRSLSTALERSFMERSDFKVFHEAFSYVYFMNERPVAIPHKHPDPDHPRTYQGVKAMMEAARCHQPVFHKDFPYHVIDHLLADPGYLLSNVNTFLVRDPEEAVLSHANVDPYLTRDVLGYAELARLFDEVANLTGEIPLVIDAADLARDPKAILRAYCDSVGIAFMPSALTWKAQERTEWATWKEWHTDVARSDGFSQPARSYRFSYRDLPHLREFVEYCRPFYEHLNRHRLRLPAQHLIAESVA